MANPRRTALYHAHQQAGARFVDFAGWDMPVQYRSILDEHRSVRTSAGMFDTSHMGQIMVRGSGAADFLDMLLPNDIAGLNPGQARYSPLCAEDGGIIDDWMIYRLESGEFLVVVNAAGREGDLQWVRQHVSADVEIEPLYDGRAMIAVQGPLAVERVMSLAGGALDSLGHFGIVSAVIAGKPALAARTGYTGEDGVELFLAAEDAEAVWDALLALRVEPCGLGARDTLRLEAGLPLYGNDIDLTTNPIEAGLGWTVKLQKSEFIGQAALAEVKKNGPSRRLVGIGMVGRGIARHGHPVAVNGEIVGQITSGSYAPTVDRAIGLAYVPRYYATIGTPIDILIRDRPVPAQVIAKPFYRRAT